MIKSFEVDHTKLEAPCIRLADIYTHGDTVVAKYDLRFITPNSGTYLSNDVMHSMEHLLATAFKDVFEDDMIDLSPMGCKTGFYFSLFVDNSIDNIENDFTTIEKIKGAITLASSADIPEPTKYNCGNFAMHNIKQARNALVLFARMFDGDETCPSFKQFTFMYRLLYNLGDTVDFYDIDFNKVSRNGINCIIDDLQYRLSCLDNGVVYNPDKF